jgi:hypothetical protein
MRQGKEDDRSDMLLGVCELLLFVGRVSRSLQMSCFRCTFVAQSLPPQSVRVVCSHCVTR